MGAEVWLLSAYAADSHRSWARQLLAYQPQYDWQLFELPGRHFRWRIRGNPLSWIDTLPSTIPDAMVATSMVDLATLKGLRPELGRVPVLYYFHENQFAYPRSSRQVPSVEPQMVQLYGALAADQLLFNSHFNRSSFMAGVEALLRKFPDAVPRGIGTRLGAKAGVLPVPVSAARRGRPRHEGPPLILWNHRWEYDKAPERFVAAVRALAEQGQAFRLALLGARPATPPPALAALRQALPERIIADGRVDNATYGHLLASADIVISTALHEFQGLAMLEAVAAGATPLVPDALCYPEQYPGACRYPAGDQAALTRRLADWLRNGIPAPPDVSAWTGAALDGRWHAALQQLLGAAAGDTALD